MSNKPKPVTLQDLVEYHERAASAVEGYAQLDVLPQAGEYGSTEKRNADHYAKRGKWHRDAAMLIKGLIQE